MLEEVEDARDFFFDLSEAKKKGCTLSVEDIDAQEPQSSHGRATRACRANTGIYSSPDPSCRRCGHRLVGNVAHV